MARDLANRKYAARVVPAKKGNGAVYNRQANKSRGNILRDFSLSKNNTNFLLSYTRITAI